MQESFSALTRLQLDSLNETPILHLESFLGGSAPRLRSLNLQRISLPALPTLLLITKDLVELRLRGIPHSGYLSPDAMVVCLYSLTKLENLVLRFSSPQPRPNSSIRRLSSLTRITLPSLTQLVFYGPNKSIEDLVAQINIPLLHHLSIMLFDDALFETSQLNQFVGRTEIFKVLRRALLEVDIYFDAARFSLSEDSTDGATLVLPISCFAYLDFQAPFLLTLSFIHISPPTILAGKPRHLDQIHTSFGIWHSRWHHVAGTVTSIRGCQGPASVQQICAASCPHVAGPDRGKSTGGSACATAHFRSGQRAT